MIIHQQHCRRHHHVIPWGKNALKIERRTPKEHHPAVVNGRYRESVEDSSTSYAAILQGRLKNWNTHSQAQQYKFTKRVGNMVLHRAAISSSYFATSIRLGSCYGWPWVTQSTLSIINTCCVNGKCGAIHENTRSTLTCISNSKISFYFIVFFSHAVFHFCMAQWESVFEYERRLTPIDRTPNIAYWIMQNDINALALQ